jgi:hypothetical protein
MTCLTAEQATEIMRAEDARSIDARILELRALAPGWLDGEGSVIAEPALSAAAQLARIVAACGQTPHIFPRPCGGATVEVLYGNSCRGVDVYIGANGAIESTTEDP